jgi:hypothetical protein
LPELALMNGRSELGWFAKIRGNQGESRQSLRETSDMTFTRYKYRAQHWVSLLAIIAWAYISSELHYFFWIFVVGMAALDLILTFNPRFGAGKIGE